MERFSDETSIFALLTDLINGLSVIWDNRIVHRDLKPENIMIKPDGKPCIIDLGIARFLDLESLTQTIAPFGPCTPVYAAPEQLKNKKELIDHRTDFFALGLMAMELHLGGHPFDPELLDNRFSIAENILRGDYVRNMPGKTENTAITGFAEKTIQLQQYNRFRNHMEMKRYMERYLP